MNFMIFLRYRQQAFSAFFIFPYHMEQLIAHLAGDYLLQNNWMAKYKTSRFSVAAVHAFVYTLPFLFLTVNFYSLFIIFITHAIIDRFSGIVIFLSRLKNLYFKGTGYPKEVPIWLSSFLVIIMDNTLHLIINYFALKL